MRKRMIRIKRNKKLLRKRNERIDLMIMINKNKTVKVKDLLEVLMI